MQPRPFEEWIWKGHQRDTNLCGAYARPTDEHSLVRGGEGYNQGSFVYFAKAWVDVESQRYRTVTSIVGFAAARPLWSRVGVPTKWSSTGKEDTGDFVQG